MIFSSIASESIATLVLLTLNVQAANPKYVIQVSTDDAKTQKIALNNAVNNLIYTCIDNLGSFKS
jgi:translation initiation factor 2 alpha subunit (eIF-2alpha)